MPLPHNLNNLIIPEMNWHDAFIEADAAGDERPTWAYDWPAGIRLADAMSEVIDLSILAKARVCDLGCGRGSLGLSLLQYGAGSMQFCDGSPQVLEYVKKTIGCNQLHTRSQCSQHLWGQPIPNAPYDLIVGGDILYRPECFSDIFNSIAQSLQANGQAILSDPRDELEAQIPQLAAQAGLQLTQKRYRHNVSVLHLTL